MERLTDRRTAAELKKNVDGLRAAGLEPSIMDKRYIKLAEYENREERAEKRGRWEYDKTRDQHFCSMCGSYTNISYLEDEIMTNYCPECSAEMIETSEDDVEPLKCNPVTMQNRTPILTVDEIHNDPQRVKEAFEFFGLDEFISKRFTETR